MASTARAWSVRPVDHTCHSVTRKYNAAMAKMPRDDLQHPRPDAPPSRHPDRSDRRAVDRDRGGRVPAGVGPDRRRGQAGRQASERCGRTPRRPIAGSRPLDQAAIGQPLRLGTALTVRSAVEVGSLESRHGPAHPASPRSDASLASRSRRSVSSRPSTSSDSNSGGPTERPVTATRTGACALPSFSP